MASEPQTVKLPAIMLQDYPLDTFPAWARDKVIDVCQRMQAAVPIAANLLLSLVSGCIARIVYVVTEDGQYEPTNIWTMSLAERGEGKTPVFVNLIKPIMESEISSYLVGDTTLASFLNRLDQEHKLIGITDEPVLIDCLVENSTIRPSSFLGAYNETFLNQDRSPSGKLKKVNIKEPSLTLGIAGQPEVIYNHYNSRNGRRLRDSGFFDRMFIVHVKNLGPRKFKRDKSLDSKSITSTYNEYMSSLAKFEQLITEVEEGKEKALFILSHEAEQRRQEFIDEWEDKYATADEYKQMRGWIRKERGFSLRLAGILYMMELVTDEESEQCPPISVEIMERAIRLLEYYREQMLNWHREVDGNDVNPNAAYLLDYLRRQEENEILQSKLKSNLKHTKGLNTKEEFEAAIKELEDRKIISVTEGEKKKTGGVRPKIVRLLKTS